MCVPQTLARTGVLLLFSWVCLSGHSQAGPLPPSAASVTPSSNVAEPWPRRERRVTSAAAAATWLGYSDALSLDDARRLGLRPRPLRTSVLESWPPEPAAPSSVAPERFEQALVQLCGSQEAGSLAGPLLESAAHFAVDPFLLAALAYQQSGCDPRHADAYGIGLTRINPGMLQRTVRAGVLRYGRPDGEGGFVPVELSIARYSFSPRSLRSFDANLYFAAALLRAFSEQCPAIDSRFGAVPHRHFVSHFVWGDRVRATLSEDEILIARRRLLDYYAPRTHDTRAHVGRVALTSPLDGAPRILMGVMGDLRDGGRRIHLGIDLGAARGEPVRAMASGVVTFAGADLRARGLIPVDPSRAADVAPATMGPRGLFVRIAHADGIETLYAHLDRYRVAVGQRVDAGELLGEVGRTGMHTSDAHLHLGVFVDGIAVDPWPILDAYAVRAGPPQPPVSRPSRATLPATLARPRAMQMPASSAAMRETLQR